MTLNPRFSRYLEHFGATVPVREFAAAPDAKSMTSLRHDVDYDIDVAMELAYWENKAGARATYFILHTTDYYRGDAALIDKCLQLQDFGHEVALHTNFLAEWYRGNIDDVGAALEAEVERLRAGGIDLTGVTAHGDALCYEAGFTNYWIFDELRPDDPAVSEARVTAEGTVGRDVDRAIEYPADSHELIRPDGKRFAYWSLKLADFGLDYEASRLPLDTYFSDSGGTWKRTPDPLSHTFGADRALVLMHPIYWKGEQKHYYFLSTARSGSSWLANFLDKATPVTARHEFTLNHEFEAGVPKLRKRTAAGFTDLVSDRKEAARLIVQARSWSEGLDTDYAEANVYLEEFLDLLPRGPDSELIHLHRDPRDVARSLLQRGWYSVPHDDRHPKIDVEGWDAMSQLEQVSWYVRDVNERLRKECHSGLAFADMVRDLPSLSQSLEKLGIPVFPRLAQEIFDQRVNATSDWDVKEIKDWPEADKETFEEICGQTRQRLGYGPAAKTGDARRRAAKRDKPETSEKAGAGGVPQTLFDPSILSQPGGISLMRCVPVQDGNGSQFTFASRAGGYLLLGGGYWSPEKELPPVLQNVKHQTLAGSLTCWSGWMFDSASVYLLDVGLEFLGEPASIRAICLSYDERGRLIAQQDIGTLSREWPSLTRYFRPRRRAKTFNVALFKGPDEGGCTIDVGRCRLVRCVENRTQLGTPEEMIQRAPELAKLPDSFASEMTEFSLKTRRNKKNLRVPMLRFDIEGPNPSGDEKKTKRDPTVRAQPRQGLREKCRSFVDRLFDLKRSYSISSHEIICGCVTAESLPEGLSYVVFGVPERDGELELSDGSFRLGTILADQTTTHFRAPFPNNRTALEIHIVRLARSAAAMKLSTRFRLVTHDEGDAAYAATIEEGPQVKMRTDAASTNDVASADAAPAGVRPLRVVAMVNNPCVVDARVIREATALAHAGHDVHVLAHTDPNVPNEEVVDGVSYQRLPVRANQRLAAKVEAENHAGPRKDITSRGKELIEDQPAVIQKTARKTAFWTRRALNLAMFLPRQAFKAVRYIVTGTGAELVRHARAYYRPAVALQPDVVHAHDLYTLLAGYLVARKTGAKLIYDSHELEVGRNGNFSRWELWLRARSERFLIGKADAVITVCDSIADYLKELYGIERPTVIHNAPSVQNVDDGSPDVRSQLNLSKDVPIALYVGSVTINRGLEHCVRALPHAEGVHLVCVGPRYKATEESILQEARQLGVEDRLHLVDPVPHDQVTSFVRSSTVSLITIQDVCLSYRFCFPNKLLESLLTGLPIVVSRLVELERIVEMTGAGVVVDETDPADIARGINEILADRDKYVPSPAVIKQLKDTYSLEVQMDRLVKLYERVAPVAADTATSR